MTVEELVERVRNTLNDYGDIEDLVATEIKTITTASDETWTVDDVSNFEEGDWVHVDWEVAEVVTTTGGVSGTMAVRRAMRGTTGAIHAVGAVVRANERFSKLQILNTLNASLAGAANQIFKVTEDVSLDTVDGQELYTLPAAHKDIRSIWVEQSVGEGDYALCRTYMLVDSDSFMLYGGWGSGYGIKVICVDKFTRMSTTGSLDSSFPDDDEAYEYLVMDTAGRLLHRMAAQEAINNSNPSRGQGEQDNRYVLLNAAKDLRAEAQKALAQCRMQKPKRIIPRPDARYF
jgi:hypothetical protein